MNYNAKLLTVTGTMSDDELARMISQAAVESERLPYCFSINHNVGAPKFEACPLPYDFTYGRTVGIEKADRELARQWIEKAIKLGYSVTFAGAHTRGIKDHEPYGQSYSIERMRARAALHQRPRIESDDDIPF